MSKKKRLKAEKQKREAQDLETSKVSEPTIKKVFLLRLYDRLLPGDYTAKQDRRHLIIMCLGCMLIVAIIAASWAHIAKKEEYAVSAKLIIPASSFANGQENTVYEMLSGYGFKDSYIDDEGNIVTFGSPEMVQAYKDSYYERTLKLARQKIEKAYPAIGIQSINVSDDAREMTIYTHGDFAKDSTLMNMALSNANVSSAISSYAIWCQMANEGEKMKTIFADVDDENRKYHETYQQTANSMIAELEAEERAKEKESQGESPDGQSEGTGDGEGKDKKEGEETKRESTSGGEGE